MSAPFVATSRLGNIIEMISLAHQNGILRVIRKNGGTQEIGQIRFTHGEPVAALLGPLVGPTALNVLSNWGECSYAFDEAVLDDPMSDLSALASDPSLTGPTVASWPTYQYPGVHPSLSSPSAAPSSFVPPDSPTLSYPTPAHLPSVAPDSYVPGPASQPVSPNGWTGSYPRQGQSQRPSGYESRQQLANLSASVGSMPLPASGPLPPQVLSVVPVRTPFSEHPDQLPLDRLERMVLLLVDGQRAVADLMRLTRRSEWDVYNVLRHLQVLGLLNISLP